MIWSVLFGQSDDTSFSTERCESSKGQMEIMAYIQTMKVLVLLYQLSNCLRNYLSKFAQKSNKSHIQTRLNSIICRCSSVILVPSRCQCQDSVFPASLFCFIFYIFFYQLWVKDHFSHICIHMSVMLQAGVIYLFIY